MGNNPKSALDAWKKRNAINAAPQSGAMNGAGAFAPASGASARQPKTALEAWKERNQPVATSQPATSAPTAAPVEELSTEQRIGQLQQRKNELTAGLDLDGAAEVQAQIDKLQRENGTSFWQRVGNVLSGAGKQTAASYSDTASAMYEAGQKGRDNQNSAFLKEQQDIYDRAERDYGMMLEDNAAKPGTWTQGDLDGQLNIMADAKRKLDAMGMVVNENVQERATTTARDFNQKLSESGAKDTEKAKEGLGGVGRLTVDAATGLAQLGGDIVAGAATGGGATVPLLLRSFGGGTMQARQDGANLQEQMAYGGLTALTELLTEKIGSVGRIQTKAFGKGGLDDIFEGVVAAAERAGKTPAGRAALNRLASAGTGFLSEGLEEAVSAAVEPLIAKATYGRDLPDIKQLAQDVAYDFLVGGAIGAVTGGVGGTDTSKVHWRTNERVTENATTKEGGEDVRYLPVPMGEDAALATRRPAEDDVRYLPKAEDRENAVLKESGATVDKETRGVMNELGLRPPAERAKIRMQAEAENEVKGLEAFGTTDLERQKQFIRARQIAQRFGCELQVEALESGMEGKYENGVITLDPTVDKPVMRVLIHELTHRMESSGLYDKFSGMMMRAMSGEMDVDTVKQAIIADYREGGIELDDDGANRELVAKFAESRLFQDEASIQRLLREGRTIFERIYDWIRDAITMVKGTEEERFLISAQRLYEKALRTSEPERGSSTTQQAIGKTTTNRPFVLVEQDILSGVPQTDWVKTVKDNLKKKFPNGITVGKNEIRIDRDSRREMTFSGYMQWLLNSDPQMYEDKLRATDNADEILMAATDWVNEGPKHSRKDDIADFARGNVLLRIGNNDYEAEVVVGARKNGKLRLYDILNLASTSFIEKETDTVDTEDPSPETDRSTASLSINSIRKTSGDVNRENAPQFPARYGSMADVQEGDYRPLPTAEEIENGGQHSYGRSFEELAETTRREAEPGMEKWERDAAKEVKAPLDELMRLYENAAGFTTEEDSWSGSPDEERMREVEALVSADTKAERKGLRENLGESWSYFKRKMVDAGDSVTQFAKAVKDDYLYPFYNFARASASAGKYMIDGEQRDIRANRVGESLNDIFNPIRNKGADYYNQFQLYMFDLHNIDRMSIGEKATVDLIEAEQALAEFDRKYPGVAQLTEDRLRRNAENRLDLEGSALARERLKLLRKVNRADRMGNKPVFDWDITAQKSKARAEQLLREHPEFAEYQQKIRKYIRNLMQYRVDSGLITAEDAVFLERYYPNYVPTYRRTVKMPGTRDRRSAHVGKTVGIAEGGTEKLQPLHEALGKQTMSVVREGSKNRFGARLLTDYLNDPKNERAGKYILGAQEYESEFGLERIDQAETEWKKENTFTVYENGKLFEIQMDPSMFEAIKALYPNALENNAVVKVIRAGNNLFKALVTGYNPTFTIRNTVRDLQTAGLHSRNAVAFAQNYHQALREIATNGSYWKRYQALGGSFASVFDYQTGTVKEPKGKLGKLAAKMEALNMAMEQAPRLAEFMSVVKAGDGSMENMMDAMHAAADVTVNFGRAGTLGKVLNANFVPFLNPGIQGFDKLVRRVVQNKGAKEWAKLAVRAAVLGVAPSLLNALLYDDDEDWEDLKDSDKDTNYLFKIGDGLWLKIPKGRELSILGMTADRIGDIVDGKEVDWGDFIATVGNQVAPANPLEQNILKAWFDTDLFDASSPGRTWYGGDIESQRLRNYAPGERYDSSVDIFSKWVGKQLNLSPKKINYLLDQYSGVLGDFALPLLTPQAERDPFTKAFTVDSVSSNRISNEFYDVSDELMYAKNGGDTTSKVADRFWKKQEDACSELYADIRAIEEDPDLSDQEKKQQVRETRVVLNGIQKNALAVLPTYRKTVEKHLKGTSDEAIDYAYREANRECFGAKYAIKVYNKDVYAKATEAKRDGVNYDVYYEYYFAKKGLKKKAEIMDVINKMDIGWKQKDALYLLEGYSEKTLDDAPWYIDRYRLPAP